MRSDPRAYPAAALEDVRRASFISFLDLARWLAASMVFLGHLRNPLFLGYGAVPTADRNPAMQGWYFVTGWHAEAVIVFFVLSGYLVGGLALAKAGIGRFQPVDYAVDRVSRLFVAFWPALLLTVLLDAAGAAWFGETGFWTHTHPMIREKVASASFASLFTGEIFLGNAAMLQTIVVPPFGSNQPLWTISLEFWFYVVFGAALTAWLARPVWTRLAGLAIVALLLTLLGPAFCVYMGLWLIGVVAALVPWRAAERPILALGLFLAALVFVRVKGALFDADATLRALRDAGVALCFGWLLVSMRGVRWRPLEIAGPVNRVMADFSYSLYLIHFPLMLFLLGALHATGAFEGIGRGYSPAEIRGIAVYAIVILLVYAGAWAFSRLTERRTAAVRAWLRRRLPSHAAAERAP